MKIAIICVVVLFLALGGVYGAATLGFLPVPGLSPIKYGKPILASTSPNAGFLSQFAVPLKMLADRERAEEAAQKPAVASVEQTAKPKPELGDEKLAELWNSMDADKLASLTEKWPPNNLARILVRMDSDKVSALLSTLKTDRAVQLSQAIQQFASLPPQAEAVTS